MKTRATLLIAEIGINHNGSPDTALQLVEAAAEAGADAVKFQVGDPFTYVNAEAWDVPRETPWGVMRYIDYRQRMELSDRALTDTRALAMALGLEWYVSPLDTGAVDRLEEALKPDAYKVASPKVTDGLLLSRIRGSGRRAIMSTGMSTEVEIREAYDRLRPWAVLHCTSAYPCPPELVNLAMIPKLARWFPAAVIGLSDHTVGVPCSVAAVAMGARVIERHLTLSRAMWGSDQAASLEPSGFRKVAEYVRTVEAAYGDGLKRVYDSERANMEKFRLTPHAVAV